MKKTASADIGGYILTITDEAYSHLEKYLRKVSGKLDGDPAEKSEILDDIEQRIGELLTKKVKRNKMAVTVDMVNEVIAIMGEPNDIGEPGEESAASGTSKKTGTKRLYRNPKDRIIAGVASGMAHYFGIGVTLMRLIWLALLLLTGIGVLPYIILWIILPKADDRLSYMDMKGEKITVESIKNMIREELRDLKNTDMSKVKDFVKDASEKTEEFVSDVFRKDNKDNKEE